MNTTEQKAADPLISIVIPTHNRAATIRLAIESVQKQTYKNWEAIIVDDGSKDRTAEIVSEIASRDPRIKFIRYDDNRGAQAARNIGIKAAKGEWIAFLDSDDQYLEHSLEVRLNVALNENTPVVHSRGYIVREDGQKELYNLPAWSGNIFKNVLGREGPMFQALLVKKEALKEMNYLDETISAYQEWETSIRLAQRNSFAFISEPTFIYDYRTENAISRNGKRNAKGYEQILNKHFLNILRHTGADGLAFHYDKAAKWYRNGNDQRNVRRCAFLSLVWKCLSFKRIRNKLGF